MVADPLRVVPDLPEGWLPEPALVLAFAKPSGDVWEILLPEYTIVARGDSFHEAMDEAAELLEDYWRMCASEGRSFAQARRPISARWMAGLVARSIGGSVASRIRDGARRRPRILRFPVDGGPIHSGPAHLAL